MSLTKKSYIVSFKTNVSTLTWGVYASNEVEAKARAVKEILEAILDVKGYKVEKIIEEVTNEESSKEAS